jgi:hypothetical protein
MPHYIGSNDRETLAGIEEILKKRIASEMRNETCYKLRRDKHAATYAVSVLQDILGDVVDAMTRGRTPTQEQLASLVITIPPDVALQMKIDNLLGQLGRLPGFGRGYRLVSRPHQDTTEWAYKVGDGQWSPPFPDDISALEDLALSLADEVRQKMGSPEQVADHLAHGEAFSDGTWEDDQGNVVAHEITAPDCDRTCLSCQGGDHPGCAMGCHDQEEPPTQTIVLPLLTDEEEPDGRTS